MKNVVPVSVCPTCGYEMDRATCPVEPNAKPSPEDATLCMKCGEVLIFNDDLTLRKSDLNDLMKLGENAVNEIGSIQNLIRKTRTIK